MIVSYLFACGVFVFSLICIVCADILSEAVFNLMLLCFDFAPMFSELNNPPFLGLKMH